MTPERYEQVIALFVRAQELASGERAAFLEGACEGDRELRAEIESLLAADDSSGSFILDRSPFATEGLAEPDEGPALAPGTRLGPYEILGRIGAGGMGEVYRAKDPRLRRDVAIKVLPPSLSGSAERLRRFAQEAYAAGSLNHPNILSVFDVGTHAGAPYLVTELLEGATLRERLRENALPAATAVEYGEQIARGLAAAHEKGVVHRDLKPDNLFVTTDGRVKILDFGLAKLTAPTAKDAHDAQASTLSNLTEAGRVMGTVTYMSPEQARGEPVDHRSDVFSFGVVLYEMLTGKRPFQRATAVDTLHAIVHDEPAPLARAGSDVCAELEPIVRRCLAKEREARYDSTKDLAVSLENVRRGALLETTPVPVRRERPALLAPRRAAILAGLVLAAVATALVYALFLRTERTSAVPEIHSLAVLPLENLSGDPSQEYFVDGMTEALITDLAKLGALRVISRPAVMQYKATRKSMPEISRELSVDALVVGSVARSGDRARVSVQLIQADTQRTLWADSYERELRDVLALQRDVARAIADEIRVTLTPQEKARLTGGGPVDPQAYDDYLRGRYFANRQNGPDNESAIASLERAVSRDPGFAAAHAELALAYVWRLFLFAPGEKQWEEKAFVEVEKALALEPNSAVAHLARGRLLWTPANKFPHGQAIQSYRRALELDPNLDEAQNQLSLVYSHIGAFDASIRELDRALAINPVNNLARLRYGETLLLQGRNEEALSILSTTPQKVQPTLVGYLNALALYDLGRKDEAATLLDEFLREHPEDPGGLFTSMQAVLAADAGRERDAEERIARAVERGRGFGHFHHTAYNVACAYALLNDRDRAMAWLEAAADDGFPCYTLFERDPKLESLRREARFVSLVAKLEQQWGPYQTPR